MHLPYSLGRIAEQRIWKLVKRPQLRLKDQAADVDGDALTGVVSVDKGLKTGPRAREEDVRVWARQQFIVLCIAQWVAAVAQFACEGATAKAVILADLWYGPAETDKE